MNRFIVATGLVCGAAAPVVAQQIVGRTETSFSIKAAVAGGDWVRIASPNGFVKITQAASDQVEIQAEKVVRRGSIESGSTSRFGSQPESASKRRAATATSASPGAQAR